MDSENLLKQPEFRRFIKELTALADDTGCAGIVLLSFWNSPDGTGHLTASASAAFQPLGGLEPHLEKMRAMLDEYNETVNPSIDRHDVVLAVPIISTNG